MAIDEQTLDQLTLAVRRYVRERLVPIEEQIAEEDRIPDSVIQDFRDMGLFGLTTPEAYGGLGLTPSEEIPIIVELCWASAAFRSIVGLNLGLGSQGILNDGTEEQKTNWLPKIATGEVITSFCLTEPDSVSEAAALSTSAVRDGEEYVLKGTKRLIHNAQIASVVLVMARTNDKRSQKKAPENGNA